MTKGTNPTAQIVATKQKPMNLIAFMAPPFLLQVRLPIFREMFGISFRCELGGPSIPGWSSQGTGARPRFSVFFFEIYLVNSGIVNPKTKVKTDPRDAKGLAEKLLTGVVVSKKGQYRASYIPRPSEYEIRKAGRLHTQFTHDRTRCKNRIHNSDFRLFCRYKTSHLRHYYYQCGLS